MTDQQLALEAISDAQLILEEYLQPCPKDNALILDPVGRSKSPGYGHLKLPHLMIAVSAAEQQ
ncbi:hypothetical protein ACVME8_008228 [Bradyrhizobium diazoefficiens]